MEDGKVTFRWRDYRHGRRPRRMTLDAGEFIRRFLLHTLPDGFHRIRHYGFLANGQRAARLAACRALLAARHRRAAIRAAPATNAASAHAPMPLLRPPDGHARRLVSWPGAAQRTSLERQLMSRSRQTTATRSAAGFHENRTDASARKDPMRRLSAVPRGRSTCKLGPGRRYPQSRRRPQPGLSGAAIRTCGPACQHARPTLPATIPIAPNRPRLRSIRLQ